MSFRVNILLLPLALLCLMLLQEGAQGCRCAPKHPQEYFCRSEVVITARVGQRTVDKMGHRAKYDIQLTRTFKGPKKNFDAIHSALSTAACGVFLTKDTEYLFMGKKKNCYCFRVFFVMSFRKVSPHFFPSFPARLLPDGTLHISSCDFSAPWGTLSFARKSLLHRYPLGCDCKITVCYSLPCAPSGPMDCPWTGFLPPRFYGERIRDFACVEKSEGSCAWERGRKVINKGK
ncbi:metalloproteinase inhibitor 2-like isoform X1 [Stigmatopora argus]